MEYVGLKGVGNELAGSLPYGVQRRVEIARALASEPRLLLLDEPTAGMNPAETEDATALFRRLRDELGITILLIEHDMRVVMNISERISVMDYGEKIAEGVPQRNRVQPEGHRGLPGTGAAAVPATGGRAVKRAGRQAMSLLELENIHSYYGKIHALKGVSLTVEEGEIVTLIGGNGAGKTTTLRSISGLLHPRKGRVRLMGKDITKCLPTVHKEGLGLVPEGRGIFPGLTVLENLEMGAYIVKDKAEIERGIEYAFSLFPRLKERSTQKGGTLSGGEQQMLAPPAGLMSNPKILLMDEPSMGLAPVARRPDLRHHQGAQRQGHDHPPRRAERADGPRRRASRLRPADGQDRAVGQSGGRRPR